ncbi:MAG: YHS domain-containing protein [Candidatus Aminicenantes bacterium]|nr:MAG: YHS domain-containing protein [Candidatus Aminicenantes bacterium]
MKHLTKILFVLIFVGLLAAPFGVLNAEKHRCPMSGKDIDKDKAKLKAEYKGETYYFCCEKCKAAFEKDPEKYLNCCEGKVSYVCPMKQCNVKSDKPGKCPKCGMELKKVVEHAVCCKHKEEHKHEHKHEHQHKHDEQKH